MKTVFQRWMVTVAGILSLAVASHSAPSWKLAGLKNQKINVILPMTGFGGDELMVGTDKGIWWFQEGEWDTAWTGLPVHGMALTASGEPVAVAGNGSDSDGVYLGEITGIAKRAVGGDGMNTWWGFSLQQKCSMPTAVAFGPLEGGCTGKVYVGSAAGVSAGMLCGSAIGALTALSTPARPFGAQCASMIVYSGDSKLYAGGNNEYPVDFTAPRYDTSWLVRGTSELTRFRRLSVTSLVEYTTQRDILFDASATEERLPDPRLLAAATVDSGIKIFEGDYLYGGLPPPVHGEPVAAIVPFSKVRTFTGFTLTMLAAATPSGVYLQCSPEADCQWTRIDGLQHRPYCLAQTSGDVLWAGTDSGLYRYDYPTGARLPPTGGRQPAQVRVNAVPAGGDAVRVRIGGERAGGAALLLFDSRGRLARTIAEPGREVTVRGLSNGCYVYRLLQGNAVVASGVVVRR